MTVFHAASRTAAALLLVAATGCGPRDSDILSLTTEDVGDYTVSASHEGDALHATVCVDSPSHAATIADRVVRQLYNHGLRSIVLDMYGTGGAIARLEWSGAGMRTEGLASDPSANPCRRVNRSSRS
jgi:hypothetical protein